MRARAEEKKKKKREVGWMSEVESTVSQARHRMTGTGWLNAGRIETRVIFSFAGKPASLWPCILHRRLNGGAHLGGDTIETERRKPRRVVRRVVRWEVRREGAGAVAEMPLGAVGWWDLGKWVGGWLERFAFGAVLVNSGHYGVSRDWAVADAKEYGHPRLHTRQREEGPSEKAMFACARPVAVSADRQ